MDRQEITQLIQRELARLVKEDEQIRRLVLEIARVEFADKAQTEDRFERMLAELDRDRQKSERRWEANQQELRTLREEQNRKWEANQQELRTLREEQNRKWEANHQTINQLLQSIKTVDRKIDRSIGALGARWGLRTEISFREALRGILVDSFGVTVENVTEFDEQGEVFGRPDQIELDIIIKNGLLIICELKFSVSKSDMYIFIKKVAFYEKRHQTQANRHIVISPMVDPYAIQVAQDYEVEVYSYPEDVVEL